MTLVLASASPRRQELLRSAGLPFSVVPSHVPEVSLPGENPARRAERLAREKAREVARTRTADFVLGADTIVVIDGEMLGKPADAADARRMLRALSGRTHQVITGVCLIHPARDGESLPPAARGEEVSSCTTLVTMSELDPGEIEFYIQSGEPDDKAGGYAIQGFASRWILRIEGDYTNVVGLPVSLVYQMLRRQGAIP